MFEAFRLAVDLHSMKLDDELGAGIIDGEHHLSHRQHADVEFFTELSTGGVENALAGFELAAGEFPETAMALVGGALADEVVVAALDHGGDDARLHKVTQATRPVCGVCD